MLMETRDLDMELLRTFVAAAERESFAVAAARVFRTQAALSLQMQRLEAVVGCALFTRVGRNKRLSDQGVRLLEYARRILSLNDEASRAMTQEVFESPVKIGACADAVDTLMPEYLEMCAETYPSLRIDIQVGRSRWLASALRRGDVDLVVDWGGGVVGRRALSLPAESGAAAGADRLGLPVPRHGAGGAGTAGAQLAPDLPDLDAGRHPRGVARGAGHHAAHH